LIELEKGSWGRARAVCFCLKAGARQLRFPVELMSDGMLGIRHAPVVALGSLYRGCRVELTASNREKDRVVILACRADWGVNRGPYRLLPIGPFSVVFGGWRDGDCYGTVFF